MELSDYFQMLSVEDRVIYFRLKGFWSDEAMSHMDTQFIALFNEAVDSMKGQRFITFADITDLRLLSKSGEAAIAAVVNYARAHGLYKAVETIPCDITEMNEEEIEPPGKYGFRVVVSSVEEGWEKINELKRLL